MVDSTSNIDLKALETILGLSNQNMSQLIQAINARFPAQSPALSALNIVNSSAGGTTLKIGSGYLMSVAVLTPSAGTGLIYDANSKANAGSSNIMTLIPSSGNAVFGYPFLNGLTVNPSSISGQAVSVYYI